MRPLHARFEKSSAPMREQRQVDLAIAHKPHRYVVAPADQAGAHLTEPKDIDQELGLRIVRRVETEREMANPRNPAGRSAHAKVAG